MENNLYNSLMNNLSEKSKQTISLIKDEFDTILLDLYSDLNSKSEIEVFNHFQEKCSLDIKQLFYHDRFSFGKDFILVKDPSCEIFLEVNKYNNFNWKNRLSVKGKNYELLVFKDTTNYLCKHDSEYIIAKNIANEYKFHSSSVKYEDLINNNILIFIKNNIKNHTCLEIHDLVKISFDLNTDIPLFKALITALKHESDIISNKTMQIQLKNTI